MARTASTIPTYKRKRKGRRGFLGWLWRMVLALFLASLAIVVIYRFVPPPITATMVGDLFAGRGLNKDWMSLDEMDRDMVRAAIAAEDSKFCQHAGFDLEAIEDAMKRNASGGRIRGGSTISQQTAKNVFLWQGGGYFRKGVEAYFTFLIEHLWGKRRIMEVYLNVAETGIGTYGVNAGAQRYFDHDASTMSRTEAARIAAVLPLPKKRGATAPQGFTRRYGNSIAARIGVVGRDGLDGCVYAGATPRDPRDAPAPARKKTAPKKVAPAPTELPGEEYERPQAIEAPAPKAAPVTSEDPVVEPAGPVEANAL